MLSGKVARKSSKSNGSSLSLMVSQNRVSCSAVVFLVVVVVGASVCWLAPPADEK